VVNFTRVADGLNLRSMNGSNHPFAYRIRPFGGGSDHYIFNDGALKVPSVMFGHGDTFHHTSLDTPDKVDPSELRRVCFIALGSTYYMANASGKEAKDMALLIARNGISRISQDYYDALPRMVEADDAGILHEAYKQVLNVIEHSLQREIQSIHSTRVFVKDRQTKKEIESRTENLNLLGSGFKKEVQKYYSSLCRKFGMKPIPVVLTAEEKRLRRVIPFRAEDFVCPLQSDYVEEKLGQGILRQVKFRGYTAYEALNFVDGKRSVYDIARAVSAEFRPVDVKDVEGFFRILEKAGLLKLKIL